MWLSAGSDEITSVVEKLAREGKAEGEIGSILRDEFGVPSVKAAVGKSISALLKEKGLQPKFPQDMLQLIKRAVGMRKHLKANAQDVASKVRLLRTESKIRRLVKYYARKGRIPRDWKYDPEQAALLVK
jgi:small subunit ribosomal protein S15